MVGHEWLQKEAGGICATSSWGVWLVEGYGSSDPCENPLTILARLMLDENPDLSIRGLVDRGADGFTIREVDAAVLEHVGKHEQRLVSEIESVVDLPASDTIRKGPGQFFGIDIVKC